jgi:glycosyltransferase involved in cell wall biosynthesis
MAEAFPRLRPNDEFLFVVRPELRKAVQDRAPRASIESPPTGLPSALRVIWEQTLLPVRLRRWKPDVVFGAYNLLPASLERPRPTRVLMITNLLPFAEERKAYPLRIRSALAGLRWFTRLSIRRANLVLVLASHARDVIGRDALGTKWRLLPPAAPASILIDRPQATSDPVFLVVADLNRYKSIETVIRAAALVGIEGLKVRVIGKASDPGYAQYLRSEIDRFGLGGVVTLEGRVDQTEVLRAMASSTATIAPSRFENLSHVLLESFAAGAPLLVADIPGVREVCGDAALYFPAEDEEALAALMQRVARDSSLRSELSRLGTARLSAVSSVDQSAAILDALTGSGSG